MMDQLKRRHDGALTWIGFSSVNNTIGITLLSELESVVDECSGLAKASALIIHGNGEKFFSPGLNLHEISRLDRAEMSDFMEAFSRLNLKLFTSPTPTLAMLNGDALAGGFLLASCCHLRYGHSGVRVGLTSLSQSVVMPFGSLKILESLIGVKETREIVKGGLCYSSEQACRVGWLDGILDKQDMELSMRRKALSFLQCSRTRQLGDRRRLAARILQDEQQHLEVFLDHWFSRKAQKQLGEIVKVLDRRSDEVESKRHDEVKGVKEE